MTDNVLHLQLPTFALDELASLMGLEIAVVCRMVRGQCVICDDGEVGVPAALAWKLIAQKYSTVARAI